MRRSLKWLAVGALFLPGCILVTDQYDDEGHSRKTSLERRVSELEEQLHDQKAACAAAGCNCMSGKAAPAATGSH